MVSRGVVQLGTEVLRFQILNRVIEEEIIIDNETGCWFVKNVNKKEYSNLELRFYRGKIKAHILAAIIFLGYEREPGKMICHKCDIPACFNPNHLYIGTASDNALDRENPKRVRISKPEEPWSQEFIDKIGNDELPDILQ